MKIEEEYTAALKYFSESSVIAQQLLGVWDSPFPSSWRKDPIDQSQSFETRVKLLLNDLKGWVALKHQECDEFEGEDIISLHGEAVGCMYAIRELQSHLGETNGS